MSEPISKQRYMTGGPAATPDPLAELARLVGRDDPFRELFSRDNPAARDSRAARFPLTGDPRRDDGLDPGETARAADEPAARDRWSEPADERRAGRDALRFPVLPDPADPFDEADERLYGARAVHGEAPPLNADLWAQGMPEPVSAEPLEFELQRDEPPVEADGSGRRTLMVLGAVVLLTVGGLGASFLVRGGSHASSASGDPPTIMADTTPTKVQPPDTSNASTGGDGTTALLEKSASDNVDNAKVVNTQERPIDLAQLPKSSVPAPTPASDDGRVGTSETMSLPEPKKVKTIMIRPDGSVVNDSAPSAADSKAMAAIAAGGSVPAMIDPSVIAVPAPAEPVAKPATPKSTARVATTPKTPSTTDGVAAIKPKPLHPAAKPKPVETADAAAPTPDPKASTAGGSFAVQLAAPSTEQDAKDVMTRLEKKYSDALGGHQPSIRKADKGDKTVYRVRVSNLSQDDAKALCTKLQSSGGSCFVVRN